MTTTAIRVRGFWLLGALAAALLAPSAHAGDLESLERETRSRLEVVIDQKAERWLSNRAPFAAPLPASPAPGALALRDPAIAAPPPLADVEPIRFALPTPPPI